MKKMRCTSCGAELKIEENNEYAVCEHCGSKYKLNEDVNINIKLDDTMKDVVKQGMETTRKASKFIFIVFGIIFITALVLIFTMTKKASDRQEENRKQSEEQQEKAKNEFDKTTFNMKFSMEEGTHVGSRVNTILDNIVMSNKTNDKKIALVYNDESITDEVKIKEIKQKIGEWDKYEVSVNYDNDGYVNEIKVVKATND